MATQPTELTETDAWTKIGMTLAEILSQFFQTEVQATGVPEAMPDPAYASSITMSDVEHQIELGLGIIADMDSAAKIAELLFDDPEMAEDEEMIADIIAELANLAMGGLKTTFSKENFKFYSGIPQPHDLHSLYRFLNHYGTQSAAAFTDSTLGLIMIAGVKRKNPVRLPAHKLGEGMVLAEDFRTDAGLLLLPAGTRMTPNFAVRLARCGADRLIKVCVPGDE